MGARLLAGASLNRLQFAMRIFACVAAAAVVALATVPSVAAYDGQSKGGYYVFIPIGLIAFLCKLCMRKACCEDEPEPLTIVRIDSADTPQRLWNFPPEGNLEQFRNEQPTEVVVKDNVPAAIPLGWAPLQPSSSSLPPSSFPATSSSVPTASTTPIPSNWVQLNTDFDTPFPDAAPPRPSSPPSFPSIPPPSYEDSVAPDSPPPYPDYLSAPRPPPPPPGLFFPLPASTGPR